MLERWRRAQAHTGAGLISMTGFTRGMIAAVLALGVMGVPGQPARAQDAAGLAVRLDRLDNQLRTLTGLIEQLQFQQKKLEEQMRKAQADADFRFQELGGKPAPVKQGAAAEAPRGPAAQAALPATPLPPLAAGPAQQLTPGGLRKPARPPSAGDAFDPASQPNAPGAPKPLGGPPLPGPATILPGGPISPGDDPDPLGNPVELGQPGQLRPAGNSGIEPLNPGAAPLTPPALIPGAPLSAPSVTAALPPAAGPVDDYQSALASLKLGQYEVAEQGLRGFILKNPRSSRLPDATYYLGETFFQRGRHREAAEQFLKISTDYSGSSRAPEGLLRLGLSLRAMGANEQACATFGEVARKYPAAPIAVRKSAEREIQRGKC